MKKVILFLFVFLCVSLVSCSSQQQQTDKEVAYINISTPNVTLFVGQTHNVSATASPSNAQDSQIFWSSSNPAICSVSYDGNMEGVSAGNCVVKAQCNNGVYASITVRIIDVEQVKKVYLSENTVTLKEGEEHKLSVFSDPISSVGNPPVTWKSSNESIATVDDCGKISAISNGTCLVEASCGGRLRAVCAVSVLDNPEEEDPVFDLEDLVYIEVRGVPATLEYKDFKTGEVITRIEISSYEIERSMYDEDGVKVSVKLNGVKIYDRDGENAENRIQLKLNLYKDEDTFCDSFLFYIEPSPEFEGKPAEAGIKVGEEFTFTFEFESIIELEQRQFYITLTDS